MSLTHTWLGAVGLGCAASRFGATGSTCPLWVVQGTKRRGHLPRSPAIFISRAMRLRLWHWPRACSARIILGLP